MRSLDFIFKKLISYTGIMAWLGLYFRQTILRGKGGRTRDGRRKSKVASGEIAAGVLVADNGSLTEG